MFNFYDFIDSKGEEVRIRENDVWGESYIVKTVRGEDRLRVHELIEYLLNELYKRG